MDCPKTLEDDWLWPCFQRNSCKRKSKLVEGLKMEECILNYHALYMKGHMSQIVSLWHVFSYI